MAMLLRGADTARVLTERMKGEAAAPGPIVIDVGIHMGEDGRLCGDVRFDEVEPVVKAITPVPGGVGAVTTSVLAGHVIEAAKLVRGGEMENELLYAR